MPMSVTIRNLSTEVEQRLQRRAAANNRSVAAEARAILENALADKNFIDEWIDGLSTQAGDEIPLPPRSLPRKLDIE